jgi:hypothetical protein
METPAHFDRLNLAVAVALVTAYEDIRLIQITTFHHQPSVLAT